MATTSPYQLKILNAIKDAHTDPVYQAAGITPPGVSVSAQEKMRLPMGAYENPTVDNYSTVLPMGAYGNPTPVQVPVNAPANATTAGLPMGAYENPVVDNTATILPMGAYENPVPTRVYKNSFLAPSAKNTVVDFIYEKYPNEVLQTELEDVIRRRPVDQVPGGVGHNPIVQSGSALDDFNVSDTAQTNAEVLPVTRRKRNARRTNIVSTRAPALKEAQVAANETAARSTNIQPDPYGYTAEDVAAMRRFEQEHPNAIGRRTGPVNTTVSPKFSDDDLAVYDWQTGKPKTDIFGFQIRSADPRDHIGDPRWGNVTQEMIEDYYRTNYTN